jgi:hypothetical protein
MTAHRLDARAVASGFKPPSGVNPPLRMVVARPVVTTVIPAPPRRLFFEYVLGRRE